jgi:hypothetical protein
LAIAKLSASPSRQDATEGYKGHGLVTFVLAEVLPAGDYDREGIVSTLELTPPAVRTIRSSVVSLYKKRFGC